MHAPFDNICQALKLGSLTAAPLPLSGGYTHRMYRLPTTRGCYAVKLLNPEIMARPDALENYRRAEGFERLLEEAGLPILPALTIGGKKLHCVDGQYLYVFDYFDGRPLQEEAITPAHCARMGRVLAMIHALARKDAEPFIPAPIDWPALSRGLDAHPECQAEAALLREHLAFLEDATRASVAAAERLPPLLCLCHNDMDRKNVLWQGDDFRVIDLECLGWADPRQEMLDLAVSWGGWPLEEARFKAFAAGYAQVGGLLPDRPGDLFDSRRNHLDWLAYNARRCLFDDARERATGRTQIHETIGKLRYDRQNRERVLRWMEEITTIQGR